MQDKMIQEKKARKKSFDLRKTTKAHQGNILATKKRLFEIAKKASNSNTTSGGTPLKLGKVPQYYPMGKVNKILSERDKDGIATVDAAAENEARENPKVSKSMQNIEEIERMMRVIDQRPVQHP